MNNSQSPPPLLPIPSNLTINESGGELVMERRWFTPVHIFLVFFALIWCSFLAFWYSMLFYSGAEGPVKLIMLIFPLLHVAVGVGLLYYAICGFVNKTIIRAQREGVSIRHQPLPWPGNKTIDRRDIRQLYVKEKVNRGRNSTSVTYQVQLLTKEGKSASFASNLTDEQARFIERKLEQHLRLENEPVEGEYRS